MDFFNGTTLSYRGDVKLTTYLNNKVISVQNYKNAGAPPLFRFIGNCLVGNFNSAGRQRPFKIKLLCNPEPSPITDTPESQIEYEAVSNFIMLSTAPELKTVTTNKGSACQVVFSFIFPVASVSRSGANTIAIYGVDTTDIKDFCASHKLTKAQDNGSGILTYEWDPLVLKEEDYEENKIFAVEWTMTIANS